MIAAWWARAGHDAVADTIPQRQRALIEIAEKGVRNLGKGIPARELRDSTIEQIATLKADQVIRDERGGSSFAFTHDIFFEWAFFRLLIDLGDEWTKALEAAGEPPLLGRVVGLMAQEAITDNGRWSEGYRSLTSKKISSALLMIQSIKRPHAWKSDGQPSMSAMARLSIPSTGAFDVAEDNRAWNGVLCLKPDQHLFEQC